MKVKVKETQEIINVEFAHTVNYGGQIEKIWQDSFSGKLYPASLLEQIIEEKMVSLDKACEVLKNTIDDDVLVKCGSVIKCMSINEFVEYFCKVMEE